MKLRDFVMAVAGWAALLVLLSIVTGALWGLFLLVTEIVQ